MPNNQRERERVVIASRKRWPTRFAIISFTILLTLVWRSSPPTSLSVRNEGQQVTAAASSSFQTSSQTVAHEGEKKARYFGVGWNKSGTNSLTKAFRMLGLRVAKQREYEALLPQYTQRNFQSIVDLVRQDESNAFQDMPFSSSFTFQAMDMAFPGSKFILTERSSSDEWFESIRNFCGKLFNGTKVNETKWNSPTLSDLRRAKYVYPGYMYDVFKSKYSLPDDDDAASKLLFDKDYLIGFYERHNLAVKHYFWNRPDDLLILNPAHDDAMERLCNFVGKPCPGKRFPHENLTVKR
eukprot:scaffold32052_cov169-Amphora_coffeaeformis.AAC.3